jgi:nitrite reductase/ring-hydroxylating ferredoxin subunit
MRKTGFLLLAVLFLTVSCKKDQQYVPYAYVNLTVYINDPGNLALTTVGGWKYFNGGYKGLIIYRKSLNEFAAYDRCCPYRPEESNSMVSVDTSNNVVMKDASCSSQFLLSDGSPIAGPAVVPLKVYRTVYNGNELLVTN